MPSKPTINVQTRTRTTIKLVPDDCGRGIDGEYLVADDDYVVFKDVLTAGEANFLLDEARVEARRDGMTTARIGDFNRNKLLAYLIEWSFLDKNDQRLPINQENLDTMHPVVFGYLVNLVDKHTERMVERRKDPKFGGGVGSGSRTNSGSATSQDGPQTGPTLLTKT